MNLLKNSIKLAAGMVLCYSAGIGQTNDLKYCGQTQAMNDLYAKHPELKHHAEALKLQQKNQQPSNLQKTTTSPYIIPVVFHIMHEYGAENISDAQVIDEVRILNEDFQMRNADTSVIVPSFKNLKADINFEFRLAKLDPNGNCTNGILHVESATTNIGDDGVKFDQWDPAMYLNIWVVKTIQSGAAGYAYYPSSADGWPAIDGIVILSDYVGSIGTGTYFRARALTHEIGHYMDLEHVWGSTNNPGVACGDDGVSDTPETKGWSTCNLNGSVCNPPIIENVQNYMEYAYCSKMYTIGQKQRMHNAINSTIANRSNLWSNANLIATGTDDASFTNSVTCKPTADFKANTKTICVNSSISFSDASYNATANSWNWFFSGGTPSVSTSSTQVVTYSAPGTYEVKLKVANAQGSDSITKTSYITVSPNTASSYSLVEGFESTTLPSLNWEVIAGSDIYNWQIAPVGATGSKSAKIQNNSASAGEADALISKAINFTNAPNTAITFKVAFAQKQTDNTDRLKVMVSKNCGQSWSTVYTKQGAALATTTVLIGGNFSPSASHWRTETVTVPSIFLGPSTQFKYEFVSGDGNNIYLDDINLTSSSSLMDQETIFYNAQLIPNPTNNNTSLNVVSATETKASLVVTDLLGKIIDRKENILIGTGENQIDINTSSFSNGLYFVTLTSNQSQITQKLIKE